jgi:hypothetical protein
MPDVLIEVVGPWLSRHKPEFLNAIHASLVEALQIPPGDKVLRLIEHPIGNFLIRSSWALLSHIGQHNPDISVG